MCVLFEGRTSWAVRERLRIERPEDEVRGLSRLVKSRERSGEERRLNRECMGTRTRKRGIDKVEEGGDRHVITEGLKIVESVARTETFTNGLTEDL